MNLYYAMGGGLGHLTRARAFLHSFGLTKNTSILTQNESAKDKRVVGDIDVIKVSNETSRHKEDYINFLKELCVKHSFETIYLDTFPFGIKGELSNIDFGNSKINYIARLMNWKKYLKLNPTNKHIKFDKSYILENLESKNKEFILQNSNSFGRININYPHPTYSPKDKEPIEQIKQKKKFWLIVHSFGKDEITDLLYIANEQRKIEKLNVEIVVITPMKYETAIEHCSVYDIYPASILFPFANRIFTACGFNVMQQTAEFRHKHHFIPVHRTYDRQFKRAKRIRKSLASNP